MTVGGYLLALGAHKAARMLANGEGDAAYLQARIVVARFYVEQLLPSAVALVEPIVKGDALLYALSAEQLAV